MAISMQKADVRDDEGGLNASACERLGALSPAKRALFESRYRSASPSPDQIIGARERVSPAPMSFAQQRLWLLAQIESETSAYNVSDVVRIRGPLDAMALANSIAAFVQRHESLRTTFAMIDGEPVQIIAPEGAVAMDVLDLRDTPAAEREGRARALVSAEANRPFDLARGPLVRATLVRVDEEEAFFVLVRHHIINDAWSNGIYYRELAELYRAFHEGTSHRLAPLAIQYADFTVWQRKRLHGGGLERELAYWKQQLDGAPALVDIVGDRPRPPVQTFAGALETIVVSAPVMKALEKIGLLRRASKFMVVLAAFDVLLARYTGRTDLVVGTPIANRTLDELEPIVGFFINTLPLRVQIDGTESFATTLERVRSVALDAFDHQELPFEKLLEALHPGRSLSHAPLVNVFFVMQTEAEGGFAIDGLVVSPVTIERTTSKFDLTLHVYADDAGLKCTFEYATDMFEASTIRRMLAAFRTLLESIARNPDIPVSQLALVDGRERHRLLVEFNASAMAPRTTSAPLHVHAAFEERAASAPEAVALRLGEETLTYGSLNARANQIARYLRAAGAGPDVPVGICVDRSFDMIAAVLGIVKSGAAYVPLDPAYPRQRLAAMAADLAVLVTQHHHVDVLPWVATTICLDDEAIVNHASCNLDLVPKSIDLAYVIHTSGSSGKPKGVAMPHGPLANLLAWQQRRSAATPRAKTLQFASLSFDVSFQEIFSTLGEGGVLVLTTDAERRDMSALLDLVLREGIERIFLPFVVLQQFVDVALARQKFPESLSSIITAGEQLKITTALRSFFAALPNCRLDNQYGPTEAHVVSAYALAGPVRDWPAVPPIGRPIDNTQLYILDEIRQPVPIGVSGELYIGGAGLARGYLSRPDLTDERFVPDPFSIDGRERLYRTGDVARFRDDGTIDFLGRADRQVKIRGFRIELADVEVAISSCPGVRDAVVVASSDRERPAELVAYVVLDPRTSIRENDVRVAASRLLPDYMIPSHVIAVGALPITTNGKLDVAALPAPVAQHASVAAPADVDNPLHMQLIALWERLLGQTGITIDDNFFELGGHSLLAVVMMNAIEETFGRRLRVAALFREPTIAAMAALLRCEAHQDAADRLIAVRRSGDRAPLFFLHGDLKGGGYYARSLLRSLDEDRPLYVFVPHGADGDQVPASIEAAAIDNLIVLRRERPHGPYVLGGYCSGGLVAYEMARRLAAAGEDVEDVLLIDSGARNARLAAFADAFDRVASVLLRPTDERLRFVGFVASRARVLRDAAIMSPVEKWQFVRREIGELFARSGFIRHAGKVPGVPPTAWDEAVVQAWHTLGARYVPRSYAGHVTLFWPSEKGASAQQNFSDDWRCVSPAATTTAVAGNHLSCIIRHLSDLSEKFSRALEARS